MPPIEKLGKYEIRREIGRGAMGVVYEGFDPMIKRVVAIKTIRADQLAREEAADILARFRREAQAAGRLNHPNVVAIYDFDEDEGTSFIAMEHVAGRDLRDYFAANERFAAADACRIVEQILAALEYSHARGVVHRDIKPANVFVLPDRTVKVADFGIAHIESSSLTQAGTVMGTPGYMSPEQILGLPVDGRSDLFSVGVILYQFLTGEQPFAGTATTTAQKVLKQDPLPPSTLNVQLPDAIDAVVRKALAKKPEERFQSAAEFAAALRAAAGHRMGASAAAPAAAEGDATVVAAPGGGAPADATLARPASATTALGAGRSAVVPPPPDYGTRGGKTATFLGVAGVAALAGILAVGLAAAVWMLWPKAATVVARNDAPAANGAPVTSVTFAVAPKDGAAAPAGAAPAESVAAQAATGAPVGTAQPPAGSGPSAAPDRPAAPPAAPAAAPAPRTAPGKLVITAVGLADPSDPRYQGDAARLQQDLRADAKGQLVEKALGLMVERASLASHYDVLYRRVVADSDRFVGPIVRESAPRIGKDGLASMTTEAVVDVKAVRKSLNEMTRHERIRLIRASGDPKIATRVVVRDADDPALPPRASPAAENMLKERIKSFGFRTWSDEGEAARTGDFLLTGEAKVRRLSTRLEASGITITKYAVTALTVKCIERATGEELYHNTLVPRGDGSHATEEEALRAAGGRIADEFSRDFFLQHVNVTGRRVVLVVDGLPAPAADLLAREFESLPLVISVRNATRPGAWTLELGGTGSAPERVAAGVLDPLNRKLGQACLAPAGSSADEVRAGFDARCAEPAVLSRLETHPPAGLYGAPAGRTKAVTSNPDTLRKLAI